MEKTVIILTGPTCVGKTSLSIELAMALDTEIISADSMLIYRSMDIATAKPTKEEMGNIKHHLIDILEPNECFSAGRFREMAIPIIDELHNRGKIPLLVGGTGLYIRSLTKGIFEGPDADWELRKELMDREKREGEGFLYNYLKTIDPEAALKIHHRDLRRTIRAIEVFLLSKRRFSHMLSKTDRTPYDFIKICLYRDRRELYRLIDERVDHMMDRGLIEETKELLRRHPNMVAMQAIGYKEMMLYLKGEKGLSEAVALIKKRTRNYAKRQFTWFRKEQNMIWIDITGVYNKEEVFERVVDSLIINNVSDKIICPLILYSKNNKISNKLQREKHKTFLRGG